MPVGGKAMGFGIVLALFVVPLLRVYSVFGVFVAPLTVVKK